MMYDISLVSRVCKKNKKRVKGALERCALQMHVGNEEQGDNLVSLNTFRFFGSSIAALALAQRAGKSKQANILEENSEPHVR